GPNLGSVGGLDRCCRDRGRGHAIEATDEEVDQVRSGNASQLGDVDVGDANAIAPVAHDHTDLPLEVVSIGLVSIAIGVLNGPLTHVTVLKARDLALWERRVPSVGAPDHDPDRRICRSGATCVEDVVGRLRVRRGLCRVAWGEAGEALWVDELVAI